MSSAPICNLTIDLLSQAGLHAATSQWYQDAILTGIIPPEDPIHIKVASLIKDMQATAERYSLKNNKNIGCNLTYADMAEAVIAKNGGKCRDSTLRKLFVIQYLIDKGFDTEFTTNLPGKTKTKFSKNAVDMVANHYPALLNYGWPKPDEKPASGLTPADTDHDAGKSNAGTRP